MPGTGGLTIDPGAGPYIPEPPNPILPLSPTELLLVVLKRDLEPSIAPAGAVVGPAEHALQQKGVVSITPAGGPLNPHMPIIWARIQVRCMAHTMAHSEQIGQHVLQLLHTRHRQLLAQPSSGNTYLVHHVLCTASPTSHYDSVATWESLAFYEMQIGTQPVS